MSDPTNGGRIVDLLLADDDEEFDGDLLVVEDLFVVLTEDLDVPAPAPDAALLAELIAAVPMPVEPRRRGLRIAVASGAFLLAASGAAAATTGSLPDGIQSALHAAADAVGIHIPDGDAQGPPTSGGSQDGPGHGRSDEAPGRPDDPGQPVDPGRSDEAPGQPEDPGSEGVGPEGVPPGQVDNPNVGGEDPTVRGEDPTVGGEDPTVGGEDPTVGSENPNANANANPNATDAGDNAGSGGSNASPRAGGAANARADGQDD
jgi:hypothetical protein